jgi:dTDP-4-dehydrorhamnose reductase
MVRVLVTGATGQIGQALMQVEWPERWHVIGCPRREFDLTKTAAARETLDRLAPDLIVNAGAYTAVDRAEADTAAAFAANADGPALLAEHCARSGAVLLHLSTDYVFDGTATTPYGEAAPVAPVNAYGASKLAGEEAIRSRMGEHLILRTSWVFGVTGQNFVGAILRRAATGAPLRVVADQYGRPTSARDIARVIRELAPRAVARDLPWGTFHYAGAEATTWHGFAREILVAAGCVTTPLAPITTAEYPTPAERPAYSVLDTARIERLGIAPRRWREDLPEVVAAIMPAQERSRGFSSAA